MPVGASGALVVIAVIKIRPYIPFTSLCIGAKLGKNDILGRIVNLVK
jgi:hypothetical protein